MTLEPLVNALKQGEWSESSGAIKENTVLQVVSRNEWLVQWLGADKAHTDL